jgi:hypothetical protein
MPAQPVEWTAEEAIAFVVPRGDGTEPRAWSEVRTLLLVVGVLSPSTAHVDR